MTEKIIIFEFFPRLSCKCQIFVISNCVNSVSILPGTGIMPNFVLNWTIRFSTVPRTA